MADKSEMLAGAASAASGVAIKSAPPAVVSGLTLAGVQLADWVYIATILWIAIQAGFFVYDRLKGRRGGRR